MQNGPAPRNHSTKRGRSVKRLENIQSCCIFAGERLPFFVFASFHRLVVFTQTFRCQSFSNSGDNSPSLAGLVEISRYAKFRCGYTVNLPTCQTQVGGHSGDSDRSLLSGSSFQKSLFVHPEWHRASAGDAESSGHQSLCRFR